MIIEAESGEVLAGDAVFSPANSKHGIKNTGDEVLEYLTANAPVFSDQYERTLWPFAPLHCEACADEAKGIEHAKPTVY